MASPEEMAAYYEDYPQPPVEPEVPETGPDSPAYRQAMDRYDTAMEQFEEAKAAHEEQYGPAPQPDPVVIPPLPGVAGGGGAGGGGGGGGGAAGAGKPAARLTDSCSHGGKVAGPGCPTVLIGYLPAARVGDAHACPVFDGPKPHGGGPVTPPGSTTVLIGFQPAARMGDQATCVGAPDTIAQGEFTVLIG